MSDFVLEAKGLVKSYPAPDNPVEVLRSASLQVSKGESVSIRGESGAGKSTLLAIISGMEQVNAGELFWRGQSVLQQSLSWQAKQRALTMGMVFQSYYLIPELTAVENVLVAARMAGNPIAAGRSRAEALLEKVGLAKREKHLPNQLSGGERQRVAIARALMNEAPLILADEPTGNLDERTGEEIMAQFLELCSEEQVSLVLVTHNPEFAQRTQRQLFLRGGQLLSEA